MDLKRQAIILIYPDGSVENIPIAEHSYHIEYYREHLTKSPRFARICQNEDFDGYYHYDIDFALASAGVIVILNMDVCILVSNLDCLGDYLPDFTLCLPDGFGSFLQGEMFYRIIEGYPMKKFLNINRCSSLKKGFESNDEIRNFVIESKSDFVNDSRGR